MAKNSRCPNADSEPRLQAIRNKRIPNIFLDLAGGQSDNLPVRLADYYFMRKPMFTSSWKHKKLPIPFRPRLEILEDRTLMSVCTVDRLTDAGQGSGLTGDLRYCMEQAQDERMVIYCCPVKTPYTATTLFCDIYGVHEVY